MVIRWPVRFAIVVAVAALVYVDRFATTYLPQANHVIVGWGCFSLLAVMYSLRKTRSMPWRMFFIVLSAFVSFRYMYWRTTETLLYSGPADFVGMFLLYVAELYGVTVHFLGMLINVWPLKQRPVAAPDDPALLPSVDVMVPTYNEDDELIRLTLTAAMQIDYPADKISVYLLDDGGTFEKRQHRDKGMAAWDRHYRLRRLAAEVGAKYITRPLNVQAKAGNINHALGHSHGELLLILDCDHVPTSDILMRTVGFFVADPKLFLVQTPHFFINPTPVERNLAGVATVSGENDMFYRVLHPGLDFWGASYFCGSAAVLRRSCLAEVGGLCGRTITEDAETSFELHSRGYRSIYFERPMVCGLSPDNYEDYIVQRTRWAQGMLQILLLHDPLFSRGLTPVQRLSYFNSCFFWLFGLARMVYFVAPAAFLVFDLNIYHSSWLQILAYALPYVLSGWIVADFFYARARQPFLSEIYESVQAMFLIPAVISVFRNPGKPSFRVTGKAVKNDFHTLSSMSVPFVVVIAFNALAMLIAGYKWFYTPLLRDVILVTGVWSLYNLVLALASLGAFWERKQIRNQHRIESDGEIAVFVPRLNRTVSGQILDVSLRGIGFSLVTDAGLRAMERVSLQVADSYGRRYVFDARLRRMDMRDGALVCGSEFVHPDACNADAVRFTFGDSERWMNLWQRQSRLRGTHRMLWHFLRLGMQGVPASCKMLWALLKHAWRFVRRETVGARSG